MTCAQSLGFETDEVRGGMNGCCAFGLGCCDAFGGRGGVLVDVDVAGAEGVGLRGGVDGGDEGGVESMDVLEDVEDREDDDSSELLDLQEDRFDASDGA
jgi:hypothetical protein